MKKTISVAPMMDCTDKHEIYFLSLISKNIHLYTEMIVANAIIKGNRDKLLSAVDRVSTIANDKSPVIKFKLLKNILNLNTVNNESSTASEDLKINYEGDEIEIGFNSKYIMDIVNNLEDEDISIKLKDNTSPIIALENSNTNLVYVLMPMRV